METTALPQNVLPSSWGTPDTAQAVANKDCACSCGCGKPLCLNCGRLCTCEGQAERGSTASVSPVLDRPSAGGAFASADVYVSGHERVASAMCTALNMRWRLAVGDHLTWSEARYTVLLRVLRAVAAAPGRGEIRVWTDPTFAEQLAQIRGERAIRGAAHLKPLHAEVQAVLGTIRTRHRVVLGTAHPNNVTGMRKARELAMDATVSPDTTTHTAPGLTLKQHLARYGLGMKECGGKGDCQFRVLAYGAEGSVSHHGTVRAAVCDRIEANRETYAGFVDGSIDAYVHEMRKAGTWGDHITLHAAVRLFRRRALVLDVGPEGSVRVTVLDGEDKDNGASEGEAHQRLRPTDLLLAYTGSHYAAVVEKDGPDTEGLLRVASVGEPLYRAQAPLKPPPQRPASRSEEVPQLVESFWSVPVVTREAAVEGACVLAWGSTDVLAAADLMRRNNGLVVVSKVRIPGCGHSVRWKVPVCAGGDGSVRMVPLWASGAGDPQEARSAMATEDTSEDAFGSAVSVVACTKALPKETNEKAVGRMQKLVGTRPLHHRSLQDGFIEGIFSVAASAVLDVLKSSGTGGVFVRLKHEQMGAAAKMDLLWSTTLAEARAQAATVEKAGIPLYGITAGAAGYAIRIPLEQRPAALDALSAAAVPRMYSVRNVPQHVDAARLVAVLKESMEWQVTDVVWSAPASAWVVKATTRPSSFLPEVRRHRLAIEDITGRTVTIRPSVSTAKPAVGGTSYAQMAGSRPPPEQVPSKTPMVVPAKKKQVPKSQAAQQPHQGQRLEDWMQAHEQRQREWQERMEQQQLRFQEVLLASVRALATAAQKPSQPTQSESHDAKPSDEPSDTEL